MCGERSPRACAPPPRGGSSPRVRGTRWDWNDGNFEQRFIPACAGNADVVAKTRHATSVHPRVCGERWNAWDGSNSNGGSSPRVRGTQFPVHEAGAKSRFIPACAGNAIRPAASRSRTPVHPRVCGERGRSAACLSASSGSSPRVRGTRDLRGLLSGDLRFIPACAGNAACAGSIPAGETVHPRVCGERGLGLVRDLQERGSSPRVRGTPGRGSRRRSDRRFIPACAGNALRQSTAARYSPVHPRVCGERFGRTTFRPRSNGSSPRVRGTRIADKLSLCGLRFIPACAGNARLVKRNNKRMAVHPRVCGERSFQKRLILKILHDVKQRTGVLSMFQAPRQGGYFHWCADLHGDRRPNIQNIDRDRFCSNTA